MRQKGKMFCAGAAWLLHRPAFLEDCHKSYGDFVFGKMLRETRSGEKAVEGHRSPRRFAFTIAMAIRASVLDCASPLALWSGPSNVRLRPHEALCFFRNALKQWFWKGCKPNSVCALRRRESFVLATIPETCFTCAKRGAGRSWVSYLALHPMGFSVPRRLRFARCALAAPFHHHRRLAPEAVCFLWHCPSKRLETFRLRVSPAKPELRSIAPGGVRTFLPRLAPGAILHPPKTFVTLH